MKNIFSSKASVFNLSVFSVLFVPALLAGFLLAPSVQASTYSKIISQSSGPACYYNFNGYGEAKSGQSFTATSTNLISLGLMISPYSTISEIKICEGDFSSSQAYVSTDADWNCDNPGQKPLLSFKPDSSNTFYSPVTGWTDFDFPFPLASKIGQKYFALFRISGTNICLQYWNDNYPNGQGRAGGFDITDFTFNIYSSSDPINWSVAIPDKVSDLKVDDYYSSGYSAKLNWSAPNTYQLSGASTYEIQYWPKLYNCQTDYGFGGMPGAKKQVAEYSAGPGQKSEAVIKDLNKNTSYCLAITSSNQFNQSELSNFIEANTNNADLTQDVDQKNDADYPNVNTINVNVPMILAQTFIPQKDNISSLELLVKSQNSAIGYIGEVRLCKGEPISSPRAGFSSEDWNCEGPNQELIATTTIDKSLLANENLPLTWLRIPFSNTKKLIPGDNYFFSFLGYKIIVGSIFNNEAAYPDGWATGANVADLNFRNFYDTGLKGSIPTFNLLGQFNSNNTILISKGTTTTENGTLFKATVVSPNNNQVQLQVEVQPIDTSFTGFPIASGNFVLSGQIASTAISNLSNGQYHWQARVIDMHGNKSDWRIASIANSFVVVNPFRPYPNGFKFGNIGLDMYSLHNEDRMDIFDKAFDFSSLPKGESKFWHDQWYDYIFNISTSSAINHGECFGFSSLAALLYEKPEYIANHFANLESLLKESDVNYLPWNLPKPGVSLFGVPIPEWVPLSEIAKFDASSIINKYLLEAITILQLQQRNDSVREAWSNSPTTAIGVFNELKNNFYDGGSSALNTKLYLLAIYSKDINSGDEFANAHAVLPYRINGNRIYVYDPNDPASSLNNAEAANNHYVEINLLTGVATYLNSPNRPDYDVLSNMRIISLDDIYGDGVLSNMKSLPPSNTFFIQGSASLSFVDDLGNKSGYYNGKSYNQITGIEPIITLGVLAGATSSVYEAPTAYRINTDVKLKVIVQDTESGSYSLTTVRDGYLANISGSTQGTSSVDTFAISSSSIQISASKDDANKTFSLILDNVVDGQDHIFTATTTVEASSTQTYSVDWNALAQGQNGVTLKIDSDNGEPVQTIQVGANFSDDLVPQTISAVDGVLGENNWYLSDTSISLTATDNQDGVGVESIKYSLDDGLWQEYVATNPIIIATEGLHVVKYLSRDYFGNQEATNTLTIKISKTAPEAKVSFDPITKNILVQGVDKIASTTVTKDSNGNYVVTNEAGHTTKLFFNKTFSLVNKLLLLQGIFQFATPAVSLDAKGNYTISDNTDHTTKPIFNNLFTPSVTTYAQLSSVQYDSAPAIKVPATHLFYVWNASDKTLSNQTIYSDKAFFMQAFYDNKTNQTTVFLKPKNSALTIKKFTGLEMLRLTTNKGVLGYLY